MTRKDFVLIASVIANLSFDDDTRAGVAEDFANKFGSTNARFDRERFLKACE